MVISNLSNGRKTFDIGDGTEVPNEMTNSDVIFYDFFNLFKGK